MTKRCSGCNQHKPREAFNKASNKPSGLQNYCKECKAADALRRAGRADIVEVKPKRPQIDFKALCGDKLITRIATWRSSGDFNFSESLYATRSGFYILDARKGFKKAIHILSEDEAMAWADRHELPVVPIEATQVTRTHPASYWESTRGHLAKATTREAHNRYAEDPKWSRINTGRMDKAIRELGKAGEAEARIAQIDHEQCTLRDLAVASLRTEMPKWARVA